jgi:hypothetical protein
VVQTRPSRYAYRPRANQFFRTVNHKRKLIHTDDPGGTGTTIVEEVQACPACAANHAQGIDVCSWP